MVIRSHSRRPAKPLKFKMKDVCHVSKNVDVIAEPMEVDRLAKSSHDNTEFDAWFSTVFAIALASVFIVFHDGSWLLRVAPILLAVGFWLRYFTSKKNPLIWVVVVDRHSVRYLRNGKLVEEVKRVDVKSIRHYTPWLSMEGVQMIKLDLCDGGVHNVSSFRLNPEDQNRFVNSIHRHWGLQVSGNHAPVSVTETSV